MMMAEEWDDETYLNTELKEIPQKRTCAPVVATVRHTVEDSIGHRTEREHNIRKTVMEGITLSNDSNMTEIQQHLLM